MVNNSRVWLPYTQMQNHLPQLEVQSASGSEITLKDGRVLVDGVASWWSAAHGYSHPDIIAKTKKQLENVPHLMLAGFKVDATYELADRLCKMTNLHSCFFVDSGSVAVEVAMKIAWKYFANIGKKEKTKFLSFEDSYHGDTTGAMSLSDLENSMHSDLKDVLVNNFNVKIPENEEDLDRFEDFLKKNHQQIAALFIEPIVRCAGGMKFSDPKIYLQIAKLVKKYDILLIADECAVGFYRLGEDFAHNICQIKPDILLLGKALTGGVMTLSAALVNEEIYQSFLSDDLGKALMHGPTFMGNALACAAANASLDLFEQNDYKKMVAELEVLSKDKLIGLKNNDHVKDIRIRGALAAIETDFTQQDMFELRKKFIAKGVFLRPFSNVIYTMPALNISQQNYGKILDVICQTL